MIGARAETFKLSLVVAQPNQAAVYPLNINGHAVRSQPIRIPGGRSATLVPEIDMQPTPSQCPLPVEPRATSRCAGGEGETSTDGRGGLALDDSVVLAIAVQRVMSQGAPPQAGGDLGRDLGVFAGVRAAPLVAA